MGSYVFIYSIFVIFHACRRIRLIFDRISKRKGLHTNYAFLEKICCRDYNEPVKIPHVIQGDKSNMLLLLAIHFS